MDAINFITYNVNGMQNKGKRNKVFNFIKNKLHSGICFFQEFHSTPECEKVWKNEWGGKIFYSHGTSNSTGVAIGFSENLNININEHKISRDELGRVLIIEATYDDKNFLLINLYNANNEKDQVEVLDTLCKLLDNHNTDGDCHTILSGDFNIIFDTILDASGGSPSLKKKTIAKLISITEMLDTCNGFRIRQPKLQRFFFSA